MTIARNEFSNTFVTNHLNPVSSQAALEEEKKGADGQGDHSTNQESSEAHSSVNVVQK